MGKYKTGRNGNYYWIEFLQNNFSLADLIAKCPEVLTNKYLAIIFFDSGPLGLKNEELNLGWHEKENIAYSPKLTNNLIINLPADQYDQWCLFNKPTEIVAITDFVNIGGFKLSDRQHELIESDPSWDLIGLKRQIAYHEQQTEKFWDEVSKVNPEIFISDGDNFIFVTKNLDEIEFLKRTAANSA